MSEAKLLPPKRGTTNCTIVKHDGMFGLYLDLEVGLWTFFMERPLEKRCGNSFPPVASLFSHTVLDAWRRWLKPPITHSLVPPTAHAGDTSSPEALQRAHQPKRPTSTMPTI